MKILVSVITLTLLVYGSTANATEGSHGDNYGSEPHGGQCPFGPPGDRPISKPEINS